MGGNQNNNEKIEVVGYSYVCNGTDVEEVKREISLLTECGGCKHHKSTDILVHLEHCLRCKRAYHAEEDRDMNEDRYEKEVNEN